VHRNVRAENESKQDDRNDSPLAGFFSKYSHSGFIYDPIRPVTDEFHRLCNILGIDPDDNDKYQVRDVRRGLKDAMVLQFNSIYGTNVKSVASWQSLCRVLGILPVPPTLKECQRVGLRLSHTLCVVHAKFPSACYQYPCQHRRSPRRWWNKGRYKVSFREGTQRIYPCDQKVLPQRECSGRGGAAGITSPHSPPSR